MRTIPGPIRWIHFLIGFLFILCPPGLVAQEVLLASISGSVQADGKSVGRMVEVRLERPDQSALATTFTDISDRFTFSNLFLKAGADYYLAIQDPCCSELRQKLNISNFSSTINPVGRDVYQGSIILELESRRREQSARRTNGSKTVSVRQLMTPIPKKAVSAYEKALKCIEESDRASAIVLLETAVEIEPDFYDAVNRLGGEYLKAGIFRKAEKMLNRARQINPKDPMPLTNLGVLYYQEGEGVLSKSRGTGEEGAPEPAEISFRKAAAVLEDALLLDPLQSKINYYLGTVLYRIGSFKRAEKLLLNAISFDARLREAHITLLNLYSRQKRYGDAVKQIQAYLKKYPDAPQRSRLEAFMAQIDSIPGKR